jgi:hypothetical protein
VSGILPVTRLALRELWITSRLLVIVAAFVMTGAVTALTPSGPTVVLERLAIGLGLATLVASALTAVAFGEERTRGAVGWLVTRSVARAAVLAGWFVAIGVLAVGGVAIAALLGWLTASSVTLQLDPAAFAVGAVAVGATALVAVALGLTVGAVVNGPLAGALAAVVTAASGVVAWFPPQPLNGANDFLPGAAFAVLAELGVSSGIGDGWRAAGAALVATALLLLVARLAVEQAEL